MADQRSHPGDWRRTTRRLDEIALPRFRFAIPTERYRCPEFAAREWRRVWLRTWQVAGRADEIPEPGD